MSSPSPKPTSSTQQVASQALTSYIFSGTALTAALTDFTSPITTLLTTTSTTSSTLEPPLWDLWAAVISLARSTPASSPNQDQLITFLSHLKTCPLPSPNVPQVWGATLWVDLPIMGATIREAWNAGPEGGVQEWINLNAFAARLTASQTLNLSLYAIWTFRSSLETRPPQPVDRVFSAHVRAACAWIQYAGPCLYRSEETWESDPRKGDPAKGGELWKGTSGFCRERWGVWKERFGVLMGVEGVEGGLREECGRCVGLMGEVEGR